MITFDPIGSHVIRSYYREFWHKHGLFYEIIQDREAIGFLGIKIMTESIAELSVFIFEQFRNRLYKSLVLSVLNFPRTLGFRILLLKTRKNSIKSMLDVMKHYKVRKITERGDESIYEKVFS